MPPYSTIAIANRAINGEAAFSVCIAGPHSESSGNSIVGISSVGMVEVPQLVIWKLAAKYCGEPNMSSGRFFPPPGVEPKRGPYDCEQLWLEALRLSRLAARVAEGRTADGSCTMGDCAKSDNDALRARMRSDVCSVRVKHAGTGNRRRGETVETRPFVSCTCPKDAIGPKIIREERVFWAKTRVGSHMTSAGGHQVGPRR